MPVIVVRDADGSINCFENRCAHRGALIAFDDGGNVQNNFKCIYHAWSYDLSGNLRGIAFEKGINGLGGMPQGLQPRAASARASCAPRRCAAWCSPRCRPTRRRSRNIIGSEVLGRIKRVLNRPIRVMGRFVQPLPNNWKLYVENVKDTYHASLLHTFLAHLPHLAPDPGRRRAGQPRRRQPCELHHRHRPRAPTPAPTRSSRSAPTDDRFALADPSVLDSVEEFGDHIQLQILSVFPGFILQQIHNCLAVRQVVPRGVGQDGPGLDLFRLRRRSRPR